MFSFASKHAYVKEEDDDKPVSPAAADNDNDNEDDDSDNSSAEEEVAEEELEGGLLDNLFDVSEQQQQQQQPQLQGVREEEQKAKGGGGIFDQLSSFFSSSSSSKNKKVAAAEKAPSGAPAAPAMVRPPPPRIRRRRHGGRGGKVIRQAADTNVVAVKFGKLSEDSEDIFAGDPCFCRKCSVAVSKTSALEEDGSWTCEFCGEQQDVEMDAEEVPAGHQRDYVVAPPEMGRQESKSSGDAPVVFVIDTSGSMCVTSEVPGHIKLKGGAAIARRADFGDLRDAVVPNAAASNTTWVSRLQCVQAAVDEQISKWKKKHPDKKVCIVSFSGQVSVLGDGTSQPTVLAGDKLNAQEQLADEAAKLRLEGTVGESADKLLEALYGLEENGPTALGPALLVAVEMVKDHRGAQVVVCTDGLANVGVGSLEAQNDEERQKAEDFYEGIGNMAQLQGTTVNVVSLKGDECALEHLGQVAEATGGSVSRVDPLNLTKDFSAILEKPIVATGVTAKVFLHRGLKFRNEDDDVVGSVLSRDLGNVTEDSEITFSYGMRSKAELKELEVDLSQLKALPFQVQIRYTKLDGMQCLRVLSNSQEVTRDRRVAEESAALDLLAANAQQQSARLASRGEFKKARANNVVWARKLAKHARKDERSQQAFGAFLAEMNEIDESMAKQDRRQIQLSSAAPPSSRGGLSGMRSKKAKKRMASAARNDEDYQLMSSMSKATSKKFGW